MNHPQKNIIEKYATGELKSAVALLVSAHLEVCHECSLLYKEILNNQVNEFTSTDYSLNAKELEDDFDLVMKKIDQDHKKDDQKKSSIKLSVNVSGQSIELPSSLSFLNEKDIVWKEFGKKNAIATISSSKEGQLYLIYIGPGEGVPHHYHSQVEYSYVAAGSYNDGVSDFSSGDFTISGAQYSHSPKATSEDGCLVVSWVEGRLNFFSGIFRPLNSILWWYLHRA